VDHPDGHCRNSVVAGSPTPPGFPVLELHAVDKRVSQSTDCDDLPVWNLLETNNREGKLIIFVALFV